MYASCESTSLQEFPTCGYPNAFWMTTKRWAKRENRHCHFFLETPFFVFVHSLITLAFFSLLRMPCPSEIIYFSLIVYLLVMMKNKRKDNNSRRLIESLVFMLTISTWAMQTCMLFCVRASFSSGKWRALVGLSVREIEWKGVGTGIGWVFRN